MSRAGEKLLAAGVAGAVDVALASPARRRFLGTSAAATGGLVFGFHIPLAFAADAPAAAIPMAAEVNAWVVVKPDDTGRTQLRVGTPSMCTVQAPHCAIPQPYFVPVSPSCSRSTHSSGVSLSAANSRTAPLTFNVAIKDHLVLIVGKLTPVHLTLSISRMHDEWSSPAR